MTESIIELKIKRCDIRIDVESISVFNKDGFLLKVNYQQIKAISKWLISKVNQLRNSSEIKSLE